MKQRNKRILLFVSAFAEQFKALDKSSFIDGTAMFTTNVVRQ